MWVRFGMRSTKRSEREKPPFGALGKVRGHLGRQGTKHAPTTDGSATGRGVGGTEGGGREKPPCGALGKVRGHLGRQGTKYAPTTHSRALGLGVGALAAVARSLPLWFLGRTGTGAGGP